MNATKTVPIIGVAVIAAIALISCAFLIRPASAPVTFGADISRGDAYVSATNTSVSCPSATSTLVLATASSSEARLYFAATNDSANNIYLCKASTCTANTGIRLNASGGAKEQAIGDLYYGPWSCIASTATSTLDITYKQ